MGRYRFIVSVKAESQDEADQKIADVMLAHRDVIGGLVERDGRDDDD